MATAPARPSLLLIQCYINDADAIITAAGIVNLSTEHPQQRRAVLEGLLNIATSMLAEANKRIDELERPPPLSWRSRMNATSINCYAFDDHLVRVIMIDGSPWFVTMDICHILGIKNWRDAVEKLDDDEKGVASTDTLGGKQEVLIVSESGLYTIILRSRAATTPGSPAHRFRKWVTAEILPQIRDTGTYSAPNTLADEAPDPDEEALIPSGTLRWAAELAMIRECRRIYGIPSCRALWPQIGLPTVPEMAPRLIEIFAGGANEGSTSLFIQDCCIELPGHDTSFLSLWQSYCKWCEAQMQAPESVNAPGRSLCARYAKRRKRGPNGGRYYCYMGVALKDEGAAEKSKA
jgi:prophage antirepressor-like protein